MKILFISDIHGNQFALEAILQKASKFKLDKIYCLGDISGYFTGINEVIDLLIKYEIKAIKGNHDEYLLNPSLVNSSKPYYDSLIKTINTIGKAQLEWIQKLENYSKIEVDNCIIEMYHGGVRDLMNEYVYPNQLNFNSYNNSSSDLILFGHTHLQFIIKKNGKIFSNPGSVGLPRNGDFRAHGILYDTVKKTCLDLKAPYDLNNINNLIINDASIDKSLFHNINFGRSSKKSIDYNNNYFFDKEIITQLLINGFYVINTIFGAVISYLDGNFLGNLIYVTKYITGEIVITSNTLLFNWQIDIYNLKNINVHEINYFKKDMAGIYYYKCFNDEKFFRINIVNIIKETNSAITKFEYEK